MVDWHERLQRALGRGNPEEMKAALAEVPGDVMNLAVPMLSRMAEEAAGRNAVEEALIYLDQLVAVEPDAVRWRLDRAALNRKRDEPTWIIEDAAHVLRAEPDNRVAARLLAEAHDGLRNTREAVEAYRRLAALEPDDDAVRQRLDYFQQQLRKDQVLQQVLNPEAASPSQPPVAEPPPPTRFDPAWLSDPAIPASTNPTMVAGLRQHLWRYGVHHASRTVLERLDDPCWLQAWDQALAATAGARVLLHGSELGLFAVRALMHGAAHVTVVETSPLDARIASGIIQKHLLAGWHARHGAQVQSWTEDERRASFEQFASAIEVRDVDAELPLASYDWLVFPNLDHTVLGTGIARTIRRYRERGATSARVLPHKARVFAMGVQWAYPGTGFDLRALNALRWAPYPQPLDLPETCWVPLTPATEVGEIDLEHFTEQTWSRELPVSQQGNLDAALFWFELDLGGACLDTGPGSGLTCLKPAVQYADSPLLEAGGTLPLRIHTTLSRISFETVPAVRELRSGALPSWYLPMVVDEARNSAYRGALAQRLQERADAAVLDIGGGCGLLSLMAAQLGARRVDACELDGALSRIAAQVVGANGAGDRVRIINKDCRHLQVPDDLPGKADLAVFELFDCSLIGEGVLHFLAYAREHLLASDALYVPMAGRVRAMLIEYRLDRVWDIDANILNPYRFSPEFINVDAERIVYKPLSAPFDVFAFDFASASAEPQERELDLVATADGTAGAVLFWFDLQLAPDQWLSNAPGAAPRFHWKQALQFLPEVQVRDGMSLPLTARHNGSALTFRWRPDTLPAESFSKLPRFDPNAFQQAAQLQAQTASLFQHCMADRGEYERVAQLAQRFAIDPAAHELDPRIAQRFAAKFLANG